MRILSVIDSLAVGGAEVAMVALVAALPEHEHAVLHCSRVNGVAAHTPYLRRLRAAGATVADVDWRVFRDADRRAAALGGFAPDVVVCHWWGGDPWAPWRQDVAAGTAPGRPRLPFVCVLHTAEHDPRPDFDRYVLVAQAQRRQVAAVAPARVAVIPNGVDTTRFRPARRARPARARAAGLVLGRLARLDEGKTPRDLVRRAAGWAVPGACWRIAGDGPLRSALEREAAALPDPAAFRFLGHVQRRSVPAYLRSLDVLCHWTGSVAEAHPLALLEAIACGVPVVAERRGGVPEIVAHGEDGLLADDPAELGAHLRRLASDRALLARLAEGARASGPRHSAAAQVAQWRALLAGLAPASA